MNYAALLGVLTAVTFTLPLVALLAEALGLHRNMGVAVSLLLALLAAAYWYVKSVRSKSAASRQDGEGGRVTGGSSYEPPKEKGAGLQRHR